jgi:hypothetical protein
MPRKLRTFSHVHYVTAAGKVRPCIVTGLATDTNPILRVGHGGEVYGTASVGIATWTRTGTRANKVLP